MTHIQLTTIKGQVFDYYIKHTTLFQFYSRVSSVMSTLSEIEDIELNNITYNLPQKRA